MNLKFWTWGKKVVETVPEVKKEEVKVEEPPRPTKRKAIMSMTVINNRTDKEYFIQSENDFGLTWEFYGIEKINKYEVLQVRQYHSLDRGDKWTSIGTFRDFSIKSTEWKEFDIVYDDEKKEEQK